MAADSHPKPLPRWGKVWGLRRLADADGHFSMVAIDQRPPLFNLVAEARRLPASLLAPYGADFNEVAELKGLLAAALAPHASALLVDPIWGLQAATPHLQPARGLVLTLEDHRYKDAPEGRRSACIPNWSVAHIRRHGAEAVKLLAWYRPDASEAVREHQQRLVQEVGLACAEHDIAFILELLVYPFAAESGSGASYEEDPAKQARLVIDSVRDFADARFGIDLFKLESPVPMATLTEPASSQAAATQAAFDAMGAACGGVPWVMLSAGASMENFERALTYARRAGAAGFLAGRAVWGDALSAWPHRAAVRQRLREQAVPYLQRLSEGLQAC